MEDYETQEVAKILIEWNPLGDDAKKIKDLNGYRIVQNIEIGSYANESDE